MDALVSNYKAEKKLLWGKAKELASLNKSLKSCTDESTYSILKYQSKALESELLNRAKILQDLRKLIKNDKTLEIVTKGGDKYTLYTEESAILGEGAFGIVFKGKSHDEKLVAIKILRKTDSSAIGAEIDIFEAVKNCSGSVKIYASGVFEENGFIIMEYCNGGSLQQKIKAKGKFSLKSAMNAICHISRGLAELHEKGIMHRDIKPANILISEGYYKIGDFGLASKKEREKDYCGTHFYIAPEIIANKEYGKEVDIYSLGVVLACMLCGKYPDEIMPLELESLNKEAIALMLKMVDPDPKKRLSAREVYKCASEIYKKIKDKIIIS